MPKRSMLERAVVAVAILMPATALATWWGYYSQVTDADIVLRDPDGKTCSIIDATFRPRREYETCRVTGYLSADTYLGWAVTEHENETGKRIDVAQEMIVQVMPASDSI